MILYKIPRKIMILDDLPTRGKLQNLKKKWCCYHTDMNVAIFVTNNDMSVFDETGLVLSGFFSSRSLKEIIFPEDHVTNRQFCFRHCITFMESLTSLSCFARSLLTNV